MAATVDITPRTLSLSKDDNYLVLSTDLISVDPAVVTLNCGSAAAPTAGQTISIGWENISVIFTFAANPDNSGLELPLRNGGESADDYRGRVETALRENETITRDWEIVNSTNQVIRFLYRIRQPLTATVSSTATGMAISQTEAGSYPSSEENLRGLVQLFDDLNPNQEAALISLENDYETTFPYQAVFNLRNLAPVSPYVPPGNSLADTVVGVNDYSVLVATGAYAHLYIRYADKYGTPPQAEALKKQDNFYVLYGGTSANSPGLLTGTNVRWLCHAYYDENGQRYRKPVSLNQPDYMFFWVNQNGLTVGVQIEVYYSDGTTDVLAVPGTSPVALSANTLYCFPCGARQLGIMDAPNYSSKTPVAYDIRLTNEAYTVPLFRMEYELIEECPEWQVVLAYSNGVGGMETVAFTGKTNFTYEVQKELFRRARYCSMTSSDGESLSYAEEGRQLFTATTTAIPRAYAQHLRQILMGETWFVDKQNMRFISSQVTSTRLNDTDDEDLYTVSVDFRFAIADQAYHRL